MDYFIVTKSGLFFIEDFENLRFVQINKREYDFFHIM